MEAWTPVEQMQRAPARELTRFHQLEKEFEELAARGADRRLYVAAIARMVQDNELPTLEPLLPLMLTMKGKPYSIKDHYPFSPLFMTHVAQTVTVKTGRQCSKSTSMASSSIMRCATIPHFRILFVTPQFEQVRRFSTNYVGEMIKNSPVRDLLVDNKCSQQTLQRSFINGSRMVFSFALLDADRTRGIDSDWCIFDEAQDLDDDHIPIILESMSHSEWIWAAFTGTPKTRDGTLEKKWMTSSQAEWFIPCTHCTTNGKRTLNVPSYDQHLIDMIGPVRDDISAKNPAILCWQCRKPINARYGRWIHKYPERRWKHSGYHIPQIILPLHYANKKKWSILRAKVDGGGTSPATIFNEVLGESYDHGTKLISQSDLEGAATLGFDNRRNPTPELIERAMSYPFRVLSIDWGGGGDDEVSFTSISLLGFRADGIIDCIWGRRLLTPNDHLREAKEVAAFIQYFDPHLIAHDYTGAGTLRETFLVQMGIPLDRIMPIAYVRSASKSVIQHVPATIHHPRDHYRADKTRSLLYTTACIRQKRLRFFKYDYVDPDNPGLLSDFLSLTEEKTHGRTAGDIYLIKRGTGPDDFAQAVNIGCLAIWHSQNAWPNFARLPKKFEMTQLQEKLSGSYRYMPAEREVDRFMDMP